MLINQVPQNIFKAVANTYGFDAAKKLLFQEGDIVEGRVLKTMSDNQALVRLRGVDMVAVSQSKLVEGQSIVGKVEQSGQQLTISLMQGENAKEAKSAQLMRLLLPTKAPLGDTLARAVTSGQAESLPPAVREAVENFARTVENVIAKDMENLTPAQTKEIIKQSGLFLETTLRKAAEGEITPKQLKEALTTDLKSALAKTIQRVEAETVKLSQVVEKLASETAQKPAAESKPPPLPARIPENGGETTLLKQQKPDVPARLMGAEIKQPAQQQTAVAKPQPTIAEQPQPGSVKTSQTTQPPPPNPTALENAGAELTRVKETLKDLKSAMNNIELNQLVNSPVKRDDGPAAQSLNLYQIPFLQGDKLESARVYIQPKDEGEGEGAAGRKNSDKSNVVFMLNMSNLGPVRVDVAVGDKKVMGSIYLTSDTAVKHVRDNLGELVSALDAGGYSAWFEVTVADKRFVTEELENHTPIAAKGLVNIRA